MKLNNCYFLTIFFATLHIYNARYTADRSESVAFGDKYELNKKVDYLILRLQWPPTVCKFSKHNKCLISSDVTSWTIHGLWPSNKNDDRPRECNNVPFDESSLQELEQELRVYWPDLYVDNKFWQHEWDDHGICALGLPNIQNQYDYFNITLELRKKYDIGTILSEKSIVPDNNRTYQIGEFERAVKNKLQVNPIFFCHSKGKAQYINELQLCFDNNFNLRECIKNDSNQCDFKKDVTYPTIKQKALRN